VARIALDEKDRQLYESATYGIAGNHSGVQICSWTKKALRGKGVCYKQKFYGVDCYRCCQMSPSVAWCHQNCIFCWRPMEWMKKAEMDGAEVDAPQDIIGECVKQRKRLLGGIGGAGDVDRRAFEHSFAEFPSHWAISLSGEPTIYPKIGELVKALRGHKEVKSIFIVTNGQEPDRIKQIAKEGNLPTQLYVSIAACDEALFKKINRSICKDGWQRLNRTLGLLKKLDCRTVIRFTLIKGMNDSPGQLRQVAEIFERSRSDFIEVKSYMHLGLSRKRLSRQNMPFHAEVRKSAAVLLETMPSYRFEDEDERSHIVLLKRKDSRHENIIKKA